MFHRKYAFTLSEVLITLVIIGVIAALTVPFIMNNTNKHEFRSAIKKAISSVNQALESHYALEGLTAADYTSAESLIDNVFKKRMNIVSSENISEFTSSDCNDNAKMFVTADGFIYCISNYSSSNSDEENIPCNYKNTTPCVQELGPNLWIDVNGVKKPNKLTASSANPKDIYQAQIFSQKVVPYGLATQEVMYNKEFGNLNNNLGSSSGNNDANQGNAGNENKPNTDVKPDPEPNPNPDVEPSNPDEPDVDSPWYDRWDPNKFPSWRDFLNWILSHIFG